MLSNFMKIKLEYRSSK